ncbi:TPA: hypothetical protein MND73_004646 [Salmonella enterica subsp. houtenae]|nr:hypothetical protein [Salmonella enterica subsp. houtenae]
MSSTQTGNINLKWDPLKKTFSDISFDYLIESNAPLNMRYSVMVNYLNIYCSSMTAYVSHHGLIDDGGDKGFKSVVVKDNSGEKVISRTGSIDAILSMQYKSYSNYFGMNSSMANGNITIKFPDLSEALNSKLGMCSGGGGFVFNIYDIV